VLFHNFFILVVRCPLLGAFTRQWAFFFVQIIIPQTTKTWRNSIMAFFTSAISVLSTLVIALGAGLAVWGVINLLEGYGNDNPGAKSQGIKQLMAGGGIVLIGVLLVPQLSTLFTIAP
jgi:hypothetical protein